MQTIQSYIQKFWKTGVIALFLILAFVAGNNVGLGNKPQQHVLAAHTHVVPTPSPTSVPVTIINNIYIPTQTPLITSQGVVPTPTPVQPSATPNPTPFVQPTPTDAPTLTPTATPTPVAEHVTVDVDYAGEHATGTYTTIITAGESAWQAVQDAIGLANLQYTDYGGSLGIFITGFNGVNAASNQYYDFQINGASASVGVSSYTVADGDVLKFVLTSF